MIGLNTIRNIEAAAYPRHMQSLQDCESWRDVEDYAEVGRGRLVVLGNKDWYCLLAIKGRKAEAVDLAKRPGSGPVPWEEILAAVGREGIREVTADMRASTSWKKFQELPLAKWNISVKVGGRWDWDGVEMVEVKIKIKIK